MILQRAVILGSASLGLALALARAGLSVTLSDPDTGAHDRIRSFLRADDPLIAPRVTLTGDPVPAGEDCFAFEALPVEDRPAARPHLGAIAGAALIATAWPTPWDQALSGPNALCLIPFQPMHLRALTELGPFAATAPATVRRAADLMVRIGRAPLVVAPGQVSPGLALWDALQAEADRLMLEGATPWDVDEAMTAAGFDLGRYEAEDLIGLDHGYARRRAAGLPRTGKGHIHIADRAVEEGRIGKKIGWGWYRYPGGGGAVIDPLVEDLAREEARFAGIAPQTLTQDDITGRLLRALADTCATLQLDRTALATALIHGLGFPRARLDQVLG